MPKYIFVTGGVVSSLGKGLAASSIGCLLEARGLRVTLMKLDPYINVDPGTMSPFQHGDVFVTDDGAETELDLGHYDRFTRAQLSQGNVWAAGELKTKPTQHSVRELREIGIAPDILLCRSDRPLSHDLRAKIALFCNVKETAVITAQDVDTIYDVPLALHDQSLDELIVSLL